MSTTIVISILALFTFPLYPACASQEYVLPPKECTVSADSHEFGDVRVTIHAKDDKIGSIALVVAGKSISIPARAYKDLSGPFRNLQLRSVAGSDDAPWLYIYFELPYKIGDSDWRWDAVRIGYHKGRIESRYRDVWNTDGSSSLKEDKF